MMCKDVLCPNCGISMIKTSVAYDSLEGVAVYKCKECLQCYKVGGNSAGKSDISVYEFSTKKK